MPGPNQRHEVGVRESAQLAFEQGGSEETGDPGDQDPLSSQALADDRGRTILVAGVCARLALGWGRLRRGDPLLYHAVDYGQGSHERAS